MNQYFDHWKNIVKHAAHITVLGRNLNHFFRFSEIFLLTDPHAIVISLLFNTDDLLTDPYDLTTLCLYHTEELMIRPYEMTTVSLSYGLVSKSWVWDWCSVVLSYPWGSKLLVLVIKGPCVNICVNKSSLWGRNSCNVIRSNNEVICMWKQECYHRYELVSHPCEIVWGVPYTPPYEKTLAVNFMHKFCIIVSNSKEYHHI